MHVHSPTEDLAEWPQLPSGRPRPDAPERRPFTADPPIPGLLLDALLPGLRAERRFVQRYLASIRNIPLPDAQAERCLVEAYRSSGDPAVLLRVILPNLRFSAGQALALCEDQVSALDLIQEANLHLLLLLSAYDPRHGVHFFSSVRHFLRRRIMRYIARNTENPSRRSEPELGRTLSALEAGRALLPGAGPVPEPPALLLRHGISQEIWQECEDRVLLRNLSLSQRSAEEMDRLCAAAGLFSDDPETLVAEREFALRARETLALVLPYLRPLFGDVLRERVLGEPPLTLAQIGQRHRITKSRVGQMAAEATSRLRRILSHMPPWNDDGRSHHFRRLVLAFCRRKLKESKMDVKTCEEVLVALSVLLDRRTGRNDAAHEYARQRLCRELALSDPGSFHSGIEQGRSQGIQKGYSQGFQQGTEQGFQRGLKQGTDQGFKEGVVHGRDLERALLSRMRLQQKDALEKATGRVRKKAEKEVRTATEHSEIRALQALAMRLCTTRFGWNREANRRICRVSRIALLDQLVLELGTAPTLEEALRRARVPTSSPESPPPAQAR